eukprot:COSAG04_NODE_43_length_31842_cov_15.704848_25_plen_213_part_00
MDLLSRRLGVLTRVAALGDVLRQLTAHLHHRLHPVLLPPNPPTLSQLDQALSISDCLRAWRTELPGGCAHGAGWIGLPGGGELHGQLAAAVTHAGRRLRARQQHLAQRLRQQSFHLGGRACTGNSSARILSTCGSERSSTARCSGLVPRVPDFVSRTKKGVEAGVGGVWGRTGGRRRSSSGTRPYRPAQASRRRPPCTTPRRQLRSVLVRNG